MPICSGIALADGHGWCMRERVMAQGIGPFPNHMLLSRCSAQLTSIGACRGRWWSSGCALQACGVRLSRCARPALGSSGQQRPCGCCSQWAALPGLLCYESDTHIHTQGPASSSSKQTAAGKNGLLALVGELWPAAILTSDSSSSIVLKHCGLLLLPSQRNVQHCAIGIQIPCWEVC